MPPVNLNTTNCTDRQREFATIHIGSYAIAYSDTSYIRLTLLHKEIEWIRILGKQKKKQFEGNLQRPMQTSITRDTKETGPTEH